MNGHPVRGFFGGLFLGLGVALLLIVFAVIALGTLTPYIIIVIGALIGLLLGMFNDRVPWRNGAPRSRPAAASSSGPTSGSGPAPGSGAPPA